MLGDILCTLFRYIWNDYLGVYLTYYGRQLRTNVNSASNIGAENALVLRVS